MESYYLLNLGLIDYHEGLELQERLVHLRQQEEIDDTLVLLEHQPVVTFGKGARNESTKSSLVNIPLEELQRKVPVYDVGRGGSVTYHGPGQLVGYPILNYSRLVGRDWKSRLPLVGQMHYMAALEEVMIQVANHYNVDVKRRPADLRRPRHIGAFYFEDGKTYKVGSVGVEIRAFPGMRVAMHGFALNVNTDMSYFELIQSCGLPNKEDISLGKILGQELSMEEVRKVTADSFSNVFGYEKVKEIELTDLLAV